MSPGLLALLLAACGDAPPSAQPGPSASAPAAETPTTETPTAAAPELPEPPPLTLLAETELRGVCEPSAAIPAQGGFVLAEDDRAKSVVRFSAGATQGEVLKRRQGKDTVSLSDLEAAAGDEARSWWLTSHSKDKAKRTRLALTELGGTQVQGCLSLAQLRAPGALQAQLARFPEGCPGCALAEGFEARGAKEGGLDIEGLARLDGTLYVGLRGPVTTDGRALVLGLSEAAAEAALAPCGEETPAALEPLLTGAWALDLGEGRGIRGLTELPEGGVLAIAGPVGAGGPFALHRWSPGAPAALAAPLPDREGASPEALFIELTEDRSALILLFDAGARVQSEFADAQAVDEEGQPAACDCEALVEGRCSRAGQPLPPDAARAPMLRYSWTSALSP